MRKRTSIAALVAVLWAAPLASQQTTLTVSQVQQIAVAAITAGDANVAVQATAALLQRSPDSPGVLIVRTEAALLARDFDGAVGFGQRAFWNAGSNSQRFAAARLVALAYAEQGKDTRAQGWLRLARQNAANAQARNDVARDFRFLRARNPLSVNLRFGIAPSTNVNNGSAVGADEQVELDLGPLGVLPFTLSGDARALSGWGISGSADLRYRVRRDETSATFVNLAISGRTYILTEGTTASLSFGQNWFGGDPNARFWTASASQSWEISPKDTFILSGSAQNQRSLTGSDPIKNYRVQGTWARDLE